MGNLTVNDGVRLAYSRSWMQISIDLRGLLSALPDEPLGATANAPATPNQYQNHLLSLRVAMG